MSPIKSPKKLIEVALPLDAINVASAREKSIRHGHPSTLHLWWARRPLATARAVIFAQMVNDPGYERHLNRGVNKKEAVIERERLFKLIEELVLWENTNNEDVLRRAREEIWKSWRETCALNKNHPQAAELFNPDKLPAFHDPFAGGGSLPLEAQRLGLESYASDLNPVAVTINKAMIEIPPKFAGREPVGPLSKDDKQPRMQSTQTDWSGARGLAEDVRRYGAWMRAEAEKRIGHLYPQIEITADMAQERPDLRPLVGQKLTVIAWLWARTVKSPNPVFSHVDVPLASTFILSSKEGKESYVEPVVDGDSYHFTVKVGKPPEWAKGGTTAGKRAAFICLLSKSPIDYNHIRAEGKAGRIKQRLMAIVAEGTKGRIYLTPTSEHEIVGISTRPEWIPETPLPERALGFRVQEYGMLKWADLFTPRQLMALTTFTDLVIEVIEHCKKDALIAGMIDNGVRVDAGGTGALAYAQAISVYLGFVVDRFADYWTSLGRWQSANQQLSNMFGRQAISMVWDFPEANPFSGKGGSFDNLFDWTIQSIQNLGLWKQGIAQQADAQTNNISFNKIISTDPPYYDNIGYADLSDFFYVWLRRSFRRIFPDLYTTLAAPKTEELVATPYRHGGKELAESYFLNGMTLAIKNFSSQASPTFPITIYYAFKQSDTKGDQGTSNTGWETFLDAILRAGLSITGTWPINTELSHRMRGIDANALASNIVLVCRKRATDAPSISRREFIRELNATLPDALEAMTRGGVNSPVAPVDLSQAIIGPGIAIFSQYAAVLEADGTPMSVRTALQLINRFFAEDDFDHDTQFCLHWFDGYGWATGKYGEADVLARAMGTSVDGLVQAGVVESGQGNMRLLRWTELSPDWVPEQDYRTSIWESLHQMVRALNQGGESSSAAMLICMPTKAEAMRALAYRLYTLCERKGWAEEARAYNELVTAWNGIEKIASEIGHVGTQQLLDL